MALLPAEDIKWATDYSSDIKVPLSYIYTSPKFLSLHGNAEIPQE
jgi:hypothetical protein